MDKNLALEFVRVTEAAAMASARWVGKGEKELADDAAVAMMRKTFNKINVDGTVVIGEGERDEAPMLFIGEKVGKGNGNIKIDIAVDPLECTNSVAYGRQNAMVVLAAAPEGTLMHAPDTYMDKIAVGPNARGVIDINATVEQNLRNIARALEKKIKDLTVMVLDRKRHEQLIKDIRRCGARIMLIPDGDVAGAIAPSIPDSGVDVLMGVGAAPEGVLAAAAISCLGGNMQARFRFRSKAERNRAKDMGITKLDDVLYLNDLVKDKNTMFAATGVTDGPFLKGVRFTSAGATTNSIVMRSKTGTVRWLETSHVFEDEPKY